MLLAIGKSYNIKPSWIMDDFVVQGFPANTFSNIPSLMVVFWAAGEFFCCSITSGQWANWKQGLAVTPYPDLVIDPCSLYHVTRRQWPCYCNKTTHETALLNDDHCHFK